MVYTIGEMADKLNITASTLRYYDKEGLLPFVERTNGGIRKFKDSDYEWLKVIECMKKAGMSIKDIRIYIQLSLEGDSTIEARGQLFENQRQQLQKQIDEMNHTMKVLEYKCWFYKMAKEKGSVEKVKEMKDEEMPEEYAKTRKELAC